MSFSCPRWSMEFGAHRNGSPEIHDMLAEYTYSESPEVVSLTAHFKNIWFLTIFNCIFLHFIFVVPVLLGVAQGLRRAKYVHIFLI